MRRTESDASPTQILESAHLARRSCDEYRPLSRLTLVVHALNARDRTEAFAREAIAQDTERSDLDETFFEERHQVLHTDVELDVFRASSHAKLDAIRCRFAEVIDEGFGACDGETRFGAGQDAEAKDHLGSPRRAMRGRDSFFGFVTGTATVIAARD